MRDVLGKMRECGKYIKMRDFPHDCGMVDTYGHVYFKRQDIICQCIITASFATEGSKQVMVLYGTYDLVLYGRTGHSR